MSSTTQISWTENPSRFRMSVAGVRAHGSACPIVIEAGYTPVAKRPVAALALGEFGSSAWRPPT